MDGFSKMTPMTKALQNKKEKQLEAKAATEATCTAEGAPVQNTGEETATGDKVPRKLLGKRAGKPSATDIEKNLKRKKLASKTQGEGKASKKNEEQEQWVFNVPQTPPRANNGPAPTTPEGRQPPPINPIYTPARPRQIQPNQR